VYLQLYGLLQWKQGFSLEQADTDVKTKINLEPSKTTQNVKHSQIKIYIPEYENDKETTASENHHDPTVKSKVKITARKVRQNVTSSLSLINNFKRYPSCFSIKYKRN
jgi:hypothetical protein